MGLQHSLGDVLVVPKRGGAGLVERGRVPRKVEQLSMVHGRFLPFSAPVRSLCPPYLPGEGGAPAGQDPALPAQLARGAVGLAGRVGRTGSLRPPFSFWLAAQALRTAPICPPRQGGAAGMGAPGGGGLSWPTTGHFSRQKNQGSARLSGETSPPVFPAVSFLPILLYFSSPVICLGGVRLSLRSPILRPGAFSSPRVR